MELAYSDTGHGLPLLCLHGGMGVDSQTLHVPGILELASQGIRLIIPDQRGHGRSVPRDETEYSHLVWASDARELAVSLGCSRLSILGHSYGGFIALEYAIRWPDTLTHLVLVATSAGPVAARMVDAATDEEVGENFRRVWPGFFSGSDKHWELFDRLTFSARPYNAAFARELPAYDVRARVGELNVPTLLIVGDGDPYRRHMEWLASHMANATLLVFPGVGHFPFIESGSAFTSRVAAFLNTRQ